MHILITGTDSESAKGGIGVVLKGYFAALDAAGIPFVCIPTYHPEARFGKWLPWIKGLPIVIKKVRDLRKEGMKPIVYSHAGGGLSLFRESFVMWVARLAGARTVIQIHAPQIDKYLKGTIAKWLLTISLMPADVVCLLTQWWKDRMETSGIRRRFYVVPNPLPPDLEEVAHHEKRTEPQSKITVLSMARLVAGKGVDVVIEAMTVLPDNIVLIVAGDGDQRNRLEQTTKKLGVSERVKFVGWVSGREKARLLELADIFCLPSTNDAFPISMVEAMAYGLPVVAVKWAGIPDMVADGRAGILVGAPEANQVAEALKKLTHPETRRRMSDEAKKWVREVSSAESVGNNLAKLFRSVV